MTEKEVLVSLFVDIGVAFTKAADRLASSVDMTQAHGFETNTQSTEVATEEPKQAPAEGYGVAKMSVADAIQVITELETEAELKAIGAEEKARGTKARKGVLKAVQEKLNKLKNPPAQAEVETPKVEAKEEKVFNVNSPATTEADRKIFKQHWAALGPKQDDYLDGKIDSLGNPIEQVIEEEAPVQEAAGDDFDDFEEPAQETAVEYTQDQVRAALQGHAKANGSDAARKILADHGVTKIKDLKVDQYASVMAGVQ